MSSLVDNNNIIEDVESSLKCWICLEPLFVPTRVQCYQADHEAMTNILSCLTCSRKLLKCNLKKNERNGKINLPCGCSLKISDAKYKVIKYLNPILNSVYKNGINCSNGCDFRAKTQREAHNHLLDDCPKSWIKCNHCNKWGFRSMINSKEHIGNHDIYIGKNFMNISYGYNILYKRSDIGKVFNDWFYSIIKSHFKGLGNHYFDDDILEITLKRHDGHSITYCRDGIKKC